MILDALLQFTSGLLATVRAAGTYLCPNSVDNGHIRGVQHGKPLDCAFRVGDAFAGGTSVEFQLIAADDGALTSNVTVLATTGPIAEAKLTANSLHALTVPQRVGQRYLGARAIGVGTHTAGSFEAFLSERVPMDKPF